jgi:hypothetical protein
MGVIPFVVRRKILQTVARQQDDQFSIFHSDFAPRHTIIDTGLGVGAVQNSLTPGKRASQVAFGNVHR